MSHNVSKIIEPEVLTELLQSIPDKKIGILGGTFNPPHLGHLIIAEHVRDQLDLDTILFIPSYEPPHKHSKKTIDHIHRVNMLERSLSGNDQFDIDFLHDFHKGMVVRHTDPALEHRVLENITICESIAKWMILQAYKQIHDGGMPLDLAEINPSDLTYAELIALPAGCADKSADPSVPGLEKIWVSGDLQQLEENL